MGKKANKATRKFAASGQLKKTIDARRKHQQIKRKADARLNRKHAGKAPGKGKGKERETSEAESGLEDDAQEDEEDVKAGKQRRGEGKKMTVDDFLGGEFMQDDDDDEMDSEADEGSGAEDVDSNQSFSDVDDLDDDGDDHIQELAKLADKDPEFYKYLQENDPELLRFTAGEADDGDEDADMDDAEEGAEEEAEEVKAPVLTKEVLKGWQKAMLQQRSLRALRKLLVAFRAATHMNEEDQVLAWNIDSPSVYNKLVTTAFRYTPVVLEHHMPYRTLPNGKYKPPTQAHKFITLNKLVLSYFHNVIHIVDQLTDPEMVELAVSESAKLLPYVVGSRKAVKTYLKMCLGLWSSAQDQVRIAAYLAMRRLISSTDDSIMDLVLKGVYLTLVRASKTTTPHTLPSINLMKNSASDLYCVDHATAYQHAFGYIRQLAVHLRNSMKTKTKESYKLVYNWQYVHSVDFWCLVLARACDKQATDQRGGEESQLQALIYPLVQVTVGAIKLVSAPRSFPFHLHLSRSLLHLTQHTHTYVPMSPYLLPIITSALSAQAKKAATLKPLDMETHIRAPQQYVKTRVYAEELVEDATFILAEWLASRPVQGSIAFPEIAVPITIVLRKALKSATKSKQSGGGKGKPSGKEASFVKGLVDRIEESAKWVEQQRKSVEFAPKQTSQVQEWERAVKVEESPLGKYVKVQRKAREKRRQLMDKAREGEDEILDE
ncbi:Noc2-domain-containing protein [Punctularia strigosozonata HHB-11173 SS5]|uniref:Noc2-domain-containing protein n=1 Tax=Punctularia strigosozonata (strain HHB-11173) TaxID=741275 RepID=UPI0004416557|nr:Noc2-domain-containing protein [Punctularia strigosozonata HHB-11173 SS5]EIN05833.1 Noc2-domain-containing protein [Punctularia strigosozonata HHB-11173 SS5]